MLTAGFLTIFPLMLLRGITIPHGGFGAIVGYFYGKCASAVLLC